MSIEDTIGCQNETPSCVVCGKNVERGGGFAHINHKGLMVNLCCPLCLETFQILPNPRLRAAVPDKTAQNVEDSNTSPKYRKAREPRISRFESFS